jgi:methionyl-tRNA formyltransferase
MNKLKIAFFGTPQFAITILDELKNAGIVPSLIVTVPDKPQGRGLTLTAPPVKVWAQKNSLNIIQPGNLKQNPQIATLSNQAWDLFIVAAYGKIIPENILEIPKYKTLNVHPSLLPDWRGPSPVEASILNDESETGVTIMRLDEEMDHGPIVSQALISSYDTWPITAPVLEDNLAHAGGKLLAETIPNWINGKYKEKPQDHSQATYCQKITKNDGLIDLTDNPYQNYLKICAYIGWPGTFFFSESNGKKIRVNIKEATFKYFDRKENNEGQLEILRVIPEGKKEMSYSDFLRGLKN